MGYEDGSLRLWDLKQGNAIYVIKGNLLTQVYHSCLWLTLHLCQVYHKKIRKGIFFFYVL